MSWIRESKHEWSQYVGRRVRRVWLKSITPGTPDQRFFVAYAGRTFCGRWNSLEEAQGAAEGRRG